MSVNTLGCTHLNIDLYSTMMTLFREQATSRSNLKIGYVGKSIITMFENVVKNFICRNNEIIVYKPIDFLFLSSLLCLNTKE
jgi:hypothetical protein